ncbi:hypothetical protein BGX31_010062 [Mortierella sp. GBA43]|nr:hypothetical protein BGX31_010062 [Mortierella sp. GBA43]
MYSSMHSSAPAPPPRPGTLSTHRASSASTLAPPKRTWPPAPASSCTSPSDLTPSSPATAVPPRRFFTTPHSSTTAEPSDAQPAGSATTSHSYSQSYSGSRLSSNKPACPVPSFPPTSHPDSASSSPPRSNVHGLARPPVPKPSLIACTPTNITPTNTTAEESDEDWQRPSPASPVKRVVPTAPASAPRPHTIAGLAKPPVPRPSVPRPFSVAAAVHTLEESEEEQPNLPPLPSLRAAKIDTSRDPADSPVPRRHTINGLAKPPALRPSLHTNLPTPEENDDRQQQIALPKRNVPSPLAADKPIVSTRRTTLDSSKREEASVPVVPTGPTRRAFSIPASAAPLKRTSIHSTQGTIEPAERVAALNSDVPKRTANTLPTPTTSPEPLPQHQEEEDTLSPEPKRSVSELLKRIENASAKDGGIVPVPRQPSPPSKPTRHTGAAVSAVKTATTTATITATTTTQIKSTEHVPPVLPHRPVLPSRPSAPEKPDLPQRPTLPQRPQLSPRPELPSRPELPPRPELPRRPEVPQRPELPQRPGLPQRPTLPKRLDQCTTHGREASCGSVTEGDHAVAVLGRSVAAVTPEFNGERLDLSRADFSALDDHAKVCPKLEETTIDRLSYYLTSPFPDDPVAQLRTIFTWVAHNIQYNMKGFLAGQLGDNSAEAVLRNRMGVCAGFANLFSALANRVPSLNVTQVQGVARGYGVEVGGLGAAHAWNAVTINGECLLIDSTWGAGCCDPAKADTKTFMPFYFLVPPEKLIYSHWPKNPKEQFLDPPIGVDVYSALPCRSPGSWEQGLEPAGEQMTHTVQTDDDYFEVDIKVWKRPGSGGAGVPHVAAHLEWQPTGERINTLVHWKQEEADYLILTVKGFCPGPGSGTLVVYSFDRSKMTSAGAGCGGQMVGHTTEAIKYKMVNEGSGANAQPLIQTFQAPGFLYSVHRPLKAKVQCGPMQTIRVQVYGVDPGVTVRLALMRSFPPKIMREVEPGLFEIQKVLKPGEYKIGYMVGMSFGPLAVFNAV